MEIDLLVDVSAAGALRNVAPDAFGEDSPATLRYDRGARPSLRVASSPDVQPPALLTMANYYGTLAAVRALGRAGIPVTTADPSRFATSAWSKFATDHVRCPSVREPERFVEWLVHFGRTSEKRVLLATSDDTAWLYSLHRDQLSPYFHLASPPVDVVYRLLNKQTLYQEAARAGLLVPRTWFPESAADLDEIGRHARFPVMVKPRTQVLFKTQSKGAYVETREQLPLYYDVMSSQPYHPALLERDPFASRPMIQEFYPQAATGIYNISGFVHRNRLRAVRAARKLLQQPRRLGTGVIFEEAPVIPELAIGLDRLVARVGYSGVFEAEFIETENGAVLIDFNPRFYNQMQFDIDRGLALPQLAYYHALGEDGLLDAMCDSMSVEPPANGAVFVDVLSLKVLLAAQRISGALSRDDRKKWTDWYAEHRDRCTHGVLDSTDRRPFLLAAAQLLARYARHPRNFVRSIALNRY